MCIAMILQRFDNPIRPKNLYSFPTKESRQEKEVRKVFGTPMLIELEAVCPVGIDLCTRNSCALEDICTTTKAPMR
jgi:hypothetical protein